MLLLSIYKSPLFSSSAPKQRLLRIVAVAALIYIIVHSYLTSSWISEEGTIANYRHYLYYLIIVDLLITGLFYLFGSQKVVQQDKDKKNKKIKRGRKIPMYPPPQLMAPTRRLMPRSQQMGQAIGPTNTQVGSQNSTQVQASGEKKQIPTGKIVQINKPDVVSGVNTTVSAPKDRNIFISQDDSNIPLYQGGQKKAIQDKKEDSFSMPIYQSKKMVQVDQRVQVQEQKQESDDNVDNDDVDNDNDDDDLEDNVIPVFHSSA